MTQQSADKDREPFVVWMLTKIAADFQHNVEDKRLAKIALDAIEQARTPVPESGALSVEVGCMEESNGRKTWIVLLKRRADEKPWDSHQVYADEIEGRAKYEAAKLRHFLGLGPEADILAFDTEPNNAAGQENKAGSASSGAVFKAADSGANAKASDSESRGLPNNPAPAAPATPRTDHAHRAAAALDEDSAEIAAAWDFARQLESELARAEQGQREALSALERCRDSAPVSARSFISTGLATQIESVADRVYELDADESRVLSAIAGEVAKLEMASRSTSGEISEPNDLDRWWKVVQELGEAVAHEDGWVLMSKEQAERMKCLDQELIWAALQELGYRIERCGASVELTHAVTLCSDLRGYVGNKWNMPDEYAAERVRFALSATQERKDG